MDIYAIWFDLANSAEDLAFSQALKEYMDVFAQRGLVHTYTLERRKFGFGPDGLGEFHVRIHCKDLTALDQAFQLAAARAEPVESLHAEVFRRVTNFRSALYRSFPDPVRLEAEQNH
jgi:hypothetical protein